MIDGASVRARLPGTITRLSGETMGTVWRIAAVLPRPGPDAGALRAAVKRRLAGIVAEMSHWEADSLLSRFNRAPAGSWWALPEDFAQVMRAALAIAEASGGAFSPALGHCVDLWGFGPPGPVSGPPDADRLAEAYAASDWRRLAFREPASLRQPGGLALDLSGIAKGFAVDALAELLAGRGVAHNTVEVGGEWRGAGARPDGQPWWVELENPPGARLAPLRVALHGLGVATSGSYPRGADPLDGATGRPATGGIVSCSVLHPSAMIADGWASALSVAGMDRGLALATDLGLAARWVRSRDGVFTEAVSPALGAMLDE